MNLMNIRRLRRNQGLTIQKLADKAGITYATLWNIENEESQPKADTLVKIAKALNVSIGELIGEVKNETEK